VTVWTLEPGRLIAKDGEPLLTISRYPRLGAHQSGYNLTAGEADALALRMVALLNSVQATEAG